MSKHPAVSYLEKKHDTFTIDNVCSCGFSDCQVVALLEEHKKYLNIFGAVRKEYIKALDDYQLRMYKIRTQLKAVEAELEFLARD